MSDTKYTDATSSSNGTLVVANWLNDVNTSTYNVISAVAGVNTITGNAATTVTVGYPRGVAFRLMPANANTDVVTINISGLGAKAITKSGTTPLVAGDLLPNCWALIIYDGTQFQLLNPQTFSTNSGILPVHNGGLGGTNPQGGNTLDMTLRNLIDNGAFNVAQRYGTAVQSGTGNFFVVDRWQMTNTTTPRVSWQQAPSTIQGFSNKLRATVTATGAPAAGDLYFLQHGFENLTFASMNFGTSQAQNLVLSFTAACSITGTFSVALRNAAATRAYVTTFTISVANTPQKFTILIPGDTGGAWVGWNGGASVGTALLSFALGAGSTFQTSTLNTWQAGANVIASSTATQITNTAGATFDLMGVQLEVDGGDHTATAFETLPYDYELRRAQRFLPALGGANPDDFGTCLLNATNGGTATCPFPIMARTPPSGIAFSPSVGSFSVTTPAAAAALNSMTYSGAGYRSGRIAFTQAGATWSTGAPGWLFSAALGAFLFFTGAEL